MTSLSRCTQAKFGSGTVPGSDPVEPDPIPGMDESSTGSDSSSPRPTLSSEFGRPLIVAGFQAIALNASIGAAVDAPPIELFTGPNPDIITP